MAYEIAALDSSRNLPQFFSNVSGFVNEQHYRMAYVPALLVVGLFCVVFAAIMTAAVAVSTAGT
jgi:hypothetical protein